MLQDLRHAARLLFKNRGFTAIAVATLALGIVLNVIVFSVLSLLLTPAAVANPNVLFGVRPADALTLGIATALLAAVALVAAWLAARRALAVDRAGCAVD